MNDAIASLPSPLIILLDFTSYVIMEGRARRRRLWKPRWRPLARDNRDFRDERDRDDRGKRDKKEGMGTSCQ